MRNGILITVLYPILFCLPAWAQEANPEPNRKLREQSIYIPYDKLQETFEKEGRGVFVPYERFHELWKAARAAEIKQPASTPPLKAMITAIDSEATVEEDVVRVHAVAKIDLLSRGWLTIPLRLSDAAVLSATIEGAPARLVPHKDGQALLLKKDTGDAEQVELKLEYAKGFTKAPGQNSVSFEAPIAPVNRWKIRVPDSGVKVNVHPMLAATEVPAENEPTENKESSAGETVVLAFVGAAPSVKIEWTPKAEGATGLDALVSVQTQQRIVIEEGISRTYADLIYEVSRAELSQLRVEVPADQKVVNVLDVNVRGWKVDASGETQTITVDLFEPSRKSQKLEIELEKFRDIGDAGEVVTPVVKALDVGRQRGILVVQVLSGLRAEPVRREGLSQMGAKEIPEAFASMKVDSSFRYATLPFDLALRVEKVKPRISVDQLVEAELDPRRIGYTLTAKYDIQKAGVFELECVVPSGFDVQNVRGIACSGADAAAVESWTIENERTLRVNLSSKALGNVGLVVELSRDLEAPNLLRPTGVNEQLLFEPPRATGDIVRSTGRLVVYAPESLRLAVGELKGLRSVSFDEAFKVIPSTLSSQKKNLRPALAYEFSGDDITATVEAQRRQPQVTARQLLVARIDPGVVKYESTFDFNVRYSGVESIRIDVPDSIADKLRNETRSLRDQPIEPAPDDVADGYTAIKFTGDTELFGNKRLKLTWEEPIDSLDVGKSVDLIVPALVPQQVTRADGQIVFAKAETIDVRPKTVADGLNPIDPEVDLMKGANVPDAAAAFEFQDNDWQLTLTATRYQLEDLKHTSVEQSILRMVITRSNRVAVQALYRMRSNMQRLEIELPHDVAEGQIEFDTEPLRINGRAVTLERGDSPRTFFVPLVGHANNLPFVLELRYTMRGDGSELRYPFFPNEPATQRVNLVAYLPQERDYIGRNGPWSPEMAWRTGDFLERRYVPKRDISGLIRQLRAGVNVIGNPESDFPVQGKPLLFATLRPQHPDDGALILKTMDRKVLDAFVLVGCLTIGVLLLSQTFVTRLVVMCGGSAIAMLLGVFAPSLAGQVLDQSLIVALVLVGLLWLSVSLLKGARTWRMGRLAFAGLTAATESPPEASVAETDHTDEIAEAEPKEDQQDEAEQQEGADNNG